jgi:hypothetical protein
LIRHRFGRLATVLTTAVLAATLGVGTVSAATPNLAATWTVIPKQVSDGDYVAFRGEITNNDTSTVSQLFLVELARDPNLPTLVSIATSQGSCTLGDPFMCTLGQLKPHRTAKITAVFLTADATASYTAIERWEFNTTGLGSGGGDNSHGDSWASDDSGADELVASVSTDGDFGGRYVKDNNVLIVQNDQAINNANPHSTRAYSPTTGIGVTVEDIDCTATVPDQLCTDLAAGFGQISKVNVNDGIDVSGTSGATLLHFYLQLDSSEILAGKNANSVNVLHTYPGGEETISDRCTFASKRATTPNNAPCITVKNLSGGDLGVDVWTFHNGGLRLS